MPTKADFEKKVLALEQRLASEEADRAMFHTELGKLALAHNCPALLSFLNFSGEELEDLTLP